MCALNLRIKFKIQKICGFKNVSSVGFCLRFFRVPGTGGDLSKSPPPPMVFFGSGTTVVSKQSCYSIMQSGIIFLNEVFKPSTTEEESPHVLESQNGHTSQIASSNWVNFQSCTWKVTSKNNEALQFDNGSLWHHTFSDVVAGETIAVL